MQAMVINEYGGPEQLVLRELPDPTPGPGEILIRVRAFGINRAETYFRRGLWGDVARVSGIECVGEVADDPSNRLPRGATVAAMMGGLARPHPQWQLCRVDRGAGRQRHPDPIGARLAGAGRDPRMLRHRLELSDRASQNPDRAEAARPRGDVGARPGGRA